MKNEIKQKVRCNLCGANDYDIIYEEKKDVLNEQELINKFKSSGDETLLDQVVKCKECGLMYINPRIRPDLIMQGYSEGEDENFISQAKYREKTFKKAFKQIEKLSKKGKILDIGTAGGSFLKVAKDAGWEVYGIEPNKWLCDWGKKNYDIDIKSGDLFQQEYKDNMFEVVTLWDVIEHTPDPMKVLKECNRILKPGGILVVNYPDVGSLIAKFTGKRWPFFLSVHLYYFTRTTIEYILTKTFFKIEIIKPHIQTLSLGYLVFRMEAYSKLLHKLGTLFVKLTGTKNLKIPYWLGQTLVIARGK